MFPAPRSQAPAPVPPVPMYMYTYGLPCMSADAHEHTIVQLECARAPDISPNPPANSIPSHRYNTSLFIIHSDPIPTQAYLFTFESRNSWSVRFKKSTTRLLPFFDIADSIRWAWRPQLLQTVRTAVVLRMTWLVPRPTRIFSRSISFLLSISPGHVSNGTREVQFGIISVIEKNFLSSSPNYRRCDAQQAAKNNRRKPLPQ